MESCREMPVSLFGSWREEWEKDKTARLISSSVINSGLQPNFLSSQARREPFTFSIDIGLDQVCDQGESGRCWAFSVLNTMRHHISRSLKLAEENFELSQNYIYFYDQLDKSWDFLTKVCETAEKGLDNRMLQEALRNPIMDNGQAFRCTLLAEKYGVVPKYVMPDTDCSKDTKLVTRILTMKLQWAAKNIRDLAATGCTAEELEARKEEILKSVYGILCRFLGCPPERFDFEYWDTAQEYHRICDLTPEEFYRQYARMDDEVMIIHHPSDTMKFHQAYVYDSFAEGNRKGPQVMLNLEMEEIKKLVISQLKLGDAVALGADVRMQNNRKSGCMDAALYDYETIFGTAFAMSKKDKLLYKAIKGTHVMTFTGVNIDKQGKPDRWKVQNSYGKEEGINGFYLMKDDWFDEYVVSVAVHKSVLPEALKALLDEDPIPVSKKEFY